MNTLGTEPRLSFLVFAQASSEEELYAWMVPLRVLVGSHNLVRTGAAGAMCYVDVARRTELVNWRNKWVDLFEWFVWLFFLVR